MLSNKLVIITGGSKGIGFDVAKKCSKEGAQIILISRNEKELIKAVKSLKGNHHHYYKLDIGIFGEVELFFKYLKNNFKKIDGLVNCAGEFGPIGLTHMIHPNEFKKSINNNLVGNFNMCHFAIPFLVKYNYGKIINFSGGGVTSPFPNYSSYSCSKIGIFKLTENISKEYNKQKLDINIVAPGFIKTKLSEQTLSAGLNAGEFYKKTKLMLKEGGVSTELVSKLIVFLLSKKSNGISGKFISANWDKWETKEFQDKLKKDKNFTTIRRIDNKFYKKIN